MKSIAVTLIALLSLTCSNAQNDDVLLGKWKANYTEDNETFSVIYEFKRDKGALKCYSIYIEIANERSDYKSLAMSKIVFNGIKGIANYTYKENNENFAMRTKLHLKDKNTLKLNYSYWGYTGEETWDRLQKASIIK
ncbi:MAG: hypothetical protein OIF50_17215 [Flavobacteriaceae bacterium]|nr:hypothetical protein [Flavobacteriaceae bacterium]